jgi:hypothetical protein
VTIEPDEKEPAIETAGDKAHRVARALIGAIPLFSGTALELFNWLVVPPIEKRKAKWMIKVSEAINELQAKYDLEIEQLREDEHFISILIYTSNLAIKNHQDEKINALKNTLINSATNKSIAEDLQFVFLNLIDEFTPTHLKILYNMHAGFCWSPLVSQAHNVALELSRILLTGYNGFKGQGDFIYQIINDLTSKNLLSTFVAQKVTKIENGELQVMGVSEWGQLLSFRSRNCNHVNVDAKPIYVTLPTELGISFLNHIYST